MDRGHTHIVTYVSHAETRKILLQHGYWPCYRHQEEEKDTVSLGEKNILKAAECHSVSHKKKRAGYTPVK